MPPDRDELTQVFERSLRHKDVPHKPWPELGFLVSAWNGLDPPDSASLAVWSGAYTTRMTFPNRVEMTVDSESDQLASALVLKLALLESVAAWEPDYGSVVNWDYWSRSFGLGNYHPVFRSGWITYLAPQHARLVAPPARAIAERVPGGGLLLLATTEQFDVDNPAHLAAADAIQLALDPLRDTEFGAA
jgi:Immunity protein 52